MEDSGWENANCLGGDLLQAVHTSKNVTNTQTSEGWMDTRKHVLKWICDTECFVIYFTSRFTYGL